MASATVGWSREQLLRPCCGDSLLPRSLSCQTWARPRRASWSAHHLLLSSLERVYKAARLLLMCSERGGRVCGGSKEGVCWNHQLSGRKMREAQQGLMDSAGPLMSHRELCPPRIWQRLPKMPASSLAVLAPREHGVLLPSWCLLVCRLAREIPHQASASVISLKPRRDSTPWGRGARRGDSQLSADRGL